MLSRLRSHLLVPVVAVPVVVGIFAAAAGLFSAGRVSAATAADDAAGQSMKAFTSVYAAVEQNFADKVEADKAVYKGAIPGMLRTLDPHSSFYDPKAGDFSTDLDARRRVIRIEQRNMPEALVCAKARLFR